MKPEESSTQGRQVRRYRERAGLSQRQLGAAAGIGHSYISRLEADLNSPSVTTLCRLARALGVDPRDLLVCPDATAEVV